MQIQIKTIQTPRIIVSFLAFWLLGWMLLGCQRIPVTEHYVNDLNGISLDRPNTWELIYLERPGAIVVTTTENLFARKGGRSRVEIVAPHCFESYPEHDINEAIITDITRIDHLYGPDTIIITSGPELYQTPSGEGVIASIQIPIKAMPDDSNRVQVSEQGPNAFQVIDIVFIRGHDYSLTKTYIYRGTNEQINQEAKAIVDSIQRVCPEDT